MSITSWKLDSVTRRMLENAFRQRQQAAWTAQTDALSARLVELAVRCLKAAYDTAQADMPTLAKYGLCTQVEAVNFQVYNPEDSRWNLSVGTKVDLPGYMIPGAHSGYVSLYVGGYAAHTSKAGQHPAHEDHDSPDWRLCMEIIGLRETYQRAQEDARKAFAAEIRATSSWRVLLRAHPWIARHFNTAEAA